MRVLVISHCCDQVWQKQVATGKVYFSSWLQRGCVHAESPSWRGRSSVSGFVCGARMWGGSHHATAHMSYDRTHARLVQTCYHMTADMLPCDFRHVMPVQMCPHVITDMASCDCTHVMWLQTCHVSADMSSHDCRRQCRCVIMQTHHHEIADRQQRTILDPGNQDQLLPSKASPYFHQPGPTP